MNVEKYVRRKCMLILEAVDELIPTNLISFFCISIVLAHCKSHFSEHVSLMYNVY